MPIPAIVLAAGASRRLGQPKQLVVFEAETLLCRAVRIAREGGADPVLVVLGAISDIILASVPLNDSIVVSNDKWQEGMASSVRAGLRTLDSVFPEAPGVLLMTCDQPRLTPEHLRKLCVAFETNRRECIIASHYAGRNGVPAIFPQALFPDLQALQGDQGARAILQSPPCRLISVEFPGGELDIDAPADLAGLGSG